MAQRLSAPYLLNRILNRVLELAALRGLTIVVAFGFALVTAHAQEIGSALICDTQEELEALVAKVNETRELQSALAEVNAAFPAKENACGMGAVAYFQGRTAKTIRTVDGLRDIVQITVVARVTRYGVRAIRPVEQYTLFRSKGEGL
jgi:hypothetical protein